MNNPKITIIIPAYNASKFIARTLDATLSQDYMDYRVIVVNDGSTDDTELAVKMYIKDSDSKIKLINKPNGGVSSARNAGIKQVDTEYFTFIDSDDIPYQNYLSELISVISTHKVDIVSAQIHPTDNETNRREVANRHARVLTGEKAAEELLYNKSVKNHPYAKLYKSQVLQDVMFDEDLAIGEDMEYVFRCLLVAKRVAVIDSVVYNYVQREGSAMNQQFSPKRMDSYKAAQKIVDTKLLPPSVAEASEVKLFTEAFSVMSRADSERVKYRDIIRQCEQTVRSLAVKVMLNQNARLRQRMYASVALVNIRLAVFIANLKRNLTN